LIFTKELLEIMPISHKNFGLLRTTGKAAVGARKWLKSAQL